MRYLVTGATGFIGGRLVGQLRDAAHDVVALVRNPSRARPLEAEGVELAPGDITDGKSLSSAMDGVDGVFHVAGWYRVGTRDVSQAIPVNVDGTRAVLEAAQERGVPKIVYTSSLAVFGDTGGRVVPDDYRHDGPWLNRYDESKWRAHYEVAVPMAGNGLPLVIVQPGLVYGPGDHSNLQDVFRDYLRRRLPVVPVQGGCWAHVDDVARGHVLAMERGRVGESYVLGGECRMWSEVLAQAHAITGVRPPRLELPPMVARMSSWLMRPLARLLTLPQNYHPDTLRLAAGVTYFADDTKARRDLGWNPRPLHEGLAETLAVESAALA